jgi:hypothetical protein
MRSPASQTTVKAALGSRPTRSGMTTLRGPSGVFSPSELLAARSAPTTGAVVAQARGLGDLRRYPCGACADDAAGLTYGACSRPPRRDHHGAVAAGWVSGAPLTARQ